MRKSLLMCITCKTNFRDRSELNYHVKRNHQSIAKVKFLNGDTVEVKREEDNTFKCKCKKTFHHPISLQRHAKRCNGEPVEPEDDERDGVLINIDDYDASESFSSNGKVIPTDCFRILICHENH
jgi:hypothetical protein